MNDFCFVKGFVFAAIGKEVDFEFETDYCEMISESENADMFVLESNLVNITKECEENINFEYNKCMYENLILLYKKQR